MAGEVYSGGNDFVVTYTDTGEVVTDPYTGEKDDNNFILECDKTALEILAAYTGGKTIKARIRESYEEGRFCDTLLILIEINYAGGLTILYEDFAYLPNGVGIVTHNYDPNEGTETITEQNFN